MKGQFMASVEGHSYRCTYHLHALRALKSQVKAVHFTVMQRMPCERSDVAKRRCFCGQSCTATNATHRRRLASSVQIDC